MYLNTSFEVVVLSTLDEHHHEEDLEFTTLDYYHWTVQQEKVPHSSFIENYDSRNYSLATSHFFIHSILSPLYLPSTRPHRQNPVSFVLQTFLIVTTFNPDCGSILGNPQKEQPDPGGAEMVQPGQWKWKPTQPFAGDLLISCIRIY